MGVSPAIAAIAPALAANKKVPANANDRKAGVGTVLSVKAV